MAVNDYALHAIDAAHTTQPSTLARALCLLGVGEAPKTQEVVHATFETAMAVMSDALARVIVEAQTSLVHLQSLEEQLLTVHEIVSREDGSLASAKADLLQHLWTKLGGNKRKMHGFERNLHLLGAVKGYRNRALAYVIATLQTLNGMQADMEELRGQVGAVHIGGDRIPVEVHMRSIQAGLERLHDGRMRAKQLRRNTVQKELDNDNERVLEGTW